jgi:hypothetical protein
LKSCLKFRRRQNPEIEANREKLMGRLEGKSVIITGAGSGIGRAASLLFTKEGARLIAVDRTEAVKETVDQVRKAGGTAEAVMADAGSEKDVIAFIDRAVSAYGRLDAIWANAGVSGGLVPLAEQTVEHWQEVLRINLIGPFLVAVGLGCGVLFGLVPALAVARVQQCASWFRPARGVGLRQSGWVLAPRSRPCRCCRPGCANGWSGLFS